LEDGDLRQQVAQNGRERVMSNFTQAQVAAETASVYRQLASAA
jgi:glycosyltransferase involved in cell wall biosynthesis